jgi:hypothetical protein
MTKYVECWGADKPFANITDSKMAKNIGLAVSVPLLNSHLYFQAIWTLSGWQHFSSLDLPLYLTFLVHILRWQFSFARRDICGADIDFLVLFNLPLQSIAMIESNLLPEENYCNECQCWGAPPRELQPVTMWYRNSAKESMFREQPEPTFRFDLMCAALIFMSIAVIQLIVFKK